MEEIIKEIGKMDCLMELELYKHLNILIREIGRKENHIRKADILGMMENFMKENMIWVKNQGRVYINFMMVKSIKVNGKMVNNMVKVH
jgi:hypothetical protein